jgi:hypothetical protein
LDLLKKLYKNIIIPEAVLKEITRIGKNHYGAEEFSGYNWITVKKVDNKKMVSALQIELDYGESEVIVLASEYKYPLVLMDEKIGRSVAKRFNIEVVGTIGILVELLHKKLIDNLKKMIDELILKNGFRVSKKLYEKIIEYELNYKKNEISL